MLWVINIPDQPSKVISFPTVTVEYSLSFTLSLPINTIAPNSGFVSLIVPWPLKDRLPPDIKNTFSSASMILLFKLILTVLFISKVLLKVILLVRLIVSVLLAFNIASSNVS